MALDFDQQLINQAKSGDRDSAIGLLKEIAGFDPRQSPGFSTQICAYLAECVREWLKTDCDPRKAPLAFNVARPKHRIASPQIRIKHIAALRTFFQKLADGKEFDEAVSLTASLHHLGKFTIRKLVASEPDLPISAYVGMDDYGNGIYRIGSREALTVEQAVAWMGLEKDDRTRAFKAYARFHPTSPVSR